MNKEIYVVTMENDELDAVEIGYASNKKISEKMIEKISSTDGFENNTYNSYKATLDYMEIDDEPICFKEDSSDDEKNLWLIIHNDSEKSNLDVQKFYGTKDEAFKKMKTMILKKAESADEDTYLEVTIDSSKMIGDIQWDESYEDYKVVRFSDIPLFNMNDAEKEEKYDSLPDDVSWVNEDFRKALTLCNK